MGRPLSGARGPLTVALAVVIGAATLTATARPARADDPLCAANPLDCLAVDQFSSTADAVSDAFFIGSLALPIGFELARGITDDSPRRGLAFAAAVGATAGTAGITKLTARRNRPYTHNTDPRVKAFAATAKGNDHSFFSGHTSIAFAALTSGAVLYNPTSHSDNARLGLWAGAGAIAATTGVLRIRAGQHFPTDVIVGAAVGTSFGLGLTLAIAPDASIRASDLGALATGVAVGALITAIAPMPNDVWLPLGARDVALTPTVGPGLAGLSLSATLR